VKTRPSIAKFQARLAGLTLGHGTKLELVPSIVKYGLIWPYNYACVDNGWEMHDPHVNVMFKADSVAHRTYPDPEGQWGDFPIYNMGSYVNKLGLEAVLDELERCLAEGRMADMWPDVTDPGNYNLVIVGVVPAEAILRIKTEVW